MVDQKEQWGSRIGLILAVAGNAVGLGNFLRFPVQAASNGGGAFMIPYFIAFLLLGIPLMWVEWSIGRHGGKYGYGSAPGMFDVLWNNSIAKYLGVIGLLISMVILIYYTYIESWTLGYGIFSMVGLYHGADSLEEMSGFLSSYQGLQDGEHFTSVWPAYGLMLFTFVVNFFVLWKGLSAGIEKLAKVAMPMLFIFAVILLIRVFTLGTPDPSVPENSVINGLAYIWNPNFDELSKASVWIAAAGQIFFTLSVGMGTIHAYASYLRPKDDIALSGLTTAATNKFVEVVLGGSIAIPVAVAFFGLDMTKEIASGGAFNLGFVSMPVIFGKIPLGQLFGAMWFFLLFVAGITSSVAMGQPVVAFFKNQFGMSHRRAVLSLATIVIICVQPVVFFLGHGFLDEMDYWSGTFGLVIFATVEIILFAWVFKIDRAWEELNRGADIRIPIFFKYVIKYVTPLYLLIIMGVWLYQDAIDILLLNKTSGGNPVDPADVPYIWGARALMVGLFLLLSLFVHYAWKRKRRLGITSFRE
ncbi:MAG: sodium-dependent transporter [Bacteroidetes bacterium]|nr:sodium-dependent transporter [Bacteroidota bacterium]